VSKISSAQWPHTRSARQAGQQPLAIELIKLLLQLFENLSRVSFILPYSSPYKISYFDALNLNLTFNNPPLANYTAYRTTAPGSREACAPPANSTCRHFYYLSLVQTHLLLFFFSRTVLSLIDLSWSRSKSWHAPINMASLYRVPTTCSILVSHGYQSGNPNRVDKAADVRKIKRQWQ